MRTLVYTKIRFLICLLKATSIVSALFVGIALSAPQTTEAKELASRLGVGFRNSYSFDLPSVAAIYYPSSDIGVIGAIGVDTEKDNSKSVFAVGVRRIIFKEENMNFFMGGNLSMISREINTQTNSGFEINALIGGEFFLSGLDSLGFNFEAGVGMSNVDKVRFRTVADDIFRAGMIFYF